MLTRLQSNVFLRKGKIRPAIEFHPGLNIVEGADGAQNSIGKSTLLQIIDFVYGGNDFLKSDVVTLPQAVRHHTIYFTLRVNGEDHHFARDTSRPDFVTVYDSPEWVHQIDEHSIDDYMEFLLTSYGLADRGTTWRDLVGRFSRDDESDLALLDKPLAAAPREPDVKGAAALLRLFGAYGKIEEFLEHYKRVDDEVGALETVAKGHYSNYIKLTTKSERNQAEKELSEARSQAKLTHRQADLDLFESERKAREGQQLLRTQLRTLTAQLDELKGKLAIVESTLAGHARITTADLEEFYTFFPDTAREQLETVEYYHGALAGILEEQLTEQHGLYQRQVAALQVKIHAQQARIVELGESVQLDDETYQRSLALNTKITQLEEQIRTFDHNQELKKERLELKKEIEETIIPATVKSLDDRINVQMHEVNDALYGRVRRKCPIFKFKSATKGVSYSFDHNGDKGSGAKSKNLVVFDLAVLRSTPLPFLIHDSAIIKTIAFGPVVELLKVYADTANLTSGANEPKQVFFSFDATKAYGSEAERIVAENQVIHLSDGPEALYGFTWNTEPDTERQIGKETR